MICHDSTPVPLTYKRERRWPLAAKRTSHADYVARIERILRETGRPFVAVDDAKRAVFSGAKIDSFDFLIYMPQGNHLLATILPKSRQTPTARQQDTLRQWQRVFGSGFAGVFIHATDEPIAIWLDGDGTRQPLRQLLQPAQSNATPNSEERLCPTTSEEVSSGSGLAP